MCTPPSLCSLCDTCSLSPACTVPGLETRGDRDPALPSWSSQSGERDVTQKCQEERMETLKRRSCLSSYKAGLFPTHTILAGKTFSVLSLSPLNSFYRLFPHPQAPAAFCLRHILSGAQTDERKVIRYGQKILQNTFEQFAFLFHGLHVHDCEYHGCSQHRFVSCYYFFLIPRTEATVSNDPGVLPRATWNIHPPEPLFWKREVGFGIKSQPCHLLTV